MTQSQHIYFDVDLYGINYNLSRCYIPKQVLTFCESMRFWLLGSAAFRMVEFDYDDCSVLIRRVTVGRYPYKVIYTQKL